MRQYPKPLARLINEMSKLPGIGTKTAQRLSFYILSLEDICLCICCICWSCFCIPPPMLPIPGFDGFLPALIPFPIYFVLRFNLFLLLCPEFRLLFGQVRCYLLWSHRPLSPACGQFPVQGSRPSVQDVQVYLP